MIDSRESQCPVTARARLAFLLRGALVAGIFANGANVANVASVASAGSVAGVAALAGTVGVAGAMSGCGDGPICPSEVVVVFASLDNGSMVIADISDAPGVQINVPVRSNLTMGDRFVLSVRGSDGALIGTMDAVSDAGGDAVFSGVTVPSGMVTLTVEAISAECGAGRDEVQVNIGGQGACELGIVETPLTSEYYGPLGVLRLSNDSDAEEPGFQASFAVTTRPNAMAELVVLSFETGEEEVIASAVADGSGMAMFPALTLDEGRQGLQSSCLTPAGSLIGTSARISVVVDTQAPACELVAPAVGTTIIPAFDLDGDPTNGTQVAVVGRADAGASDDVEGESAGFAFDGESAVNGSPVDGSGESLYVASFTVQGSYEIAFSTQDHAGNACMVSRVFDYVTEGCDIAFIGPVDTVTADENGDPTDGVQTTLRVDVDAACAGQAVTTDCGIGTASAVVPADGRVALRVTMCAESECEVSDTCTISVQSTVGIETSVDAMITVDNQAPSVALELVDPAITCGGRVVPSGDVDGNAQNGLQIDVRVVSPAAEERAVEVTGNAGSAVFATGDSGDVRITLQPGENQIVAIARDALANERQTALCSIWYYELDISFEPNIADGVVGTSDGVVMNGELTLDICGRVSEAGAAVEASINGGAPMEAFVMGIIWCVKDVRLPASPPAHTIVVSATSDTKLGFASLALNVDLTGPVAANTP